MIRNPSSSGASRLSRISIFSTAIEFASAMASAAFFDKELAKNSERAEPTAALKRFVILPLRKDKSLIIDFYRNNVPLVDSVIRLVALQLTTPIAPRSATAGQNAFSLTGSARREVLITLPQ